MIWLIAQFMQIDCKCWACEGFRSFFCRRNTVIDRRVDLQEIATFRRPLGEVQSKQIFENYWILI